MRPYGATTPADEVRLEAAGPAAPAGDPALEAGGPDSQPLLALATLFLAALVCLATVHALVVAKSVLLPIVLAFLLTTILEPPVREVSRWGVPRVLAGGGMLFVLITGAYLAATSLSGPASAFIEELPSQLREMERQVRHLGEAAEAAREIDEATEGLSQQISGSSEPSVRVDGPGLVETALGYVRSLGAGLVLMAALLLLLLIVEDNPLRAIPGYREVERSVSRYLGTITLINAALGAATAAALATVGVPNPLLWGAVAAVLNYVLFLGPLVTVSLLALVGVTNFDEPVHMLLPPALYLGLNLIEAYLVTPWLVGRHLQISPLLIVLSLAFWGFVWGVPGMLIAVPLLIVAKLVARQLELDPRIARLGGWLQRTPAARRGAGA